MHVTRNVRSFLISTAVALALTVSTPARACSVCGCGDPLLAASDPAAITGQLRLQIDTESEATYFDASKYKFGDALLWSVHGQYRPLRRLALDLGVDGRYAKADTATDSDGTVEDAVGNTGGTLLSAAPGVYFNATGGLWLFVRGQIPFYKHLLGNQDVLPSFTTGIQFQAL
jgi:hypothetical protein